MASCQKAPPTSAASTRRRETSASPKTTTRRQCLRHPLAHHLPREPLSKSQLRIRESDPWTRRACRWPTERWAIIVVKRVKGGRGERLDPWTRRACRWPTERLEGIGERIGEGGGDRGEDRGGDRGGDEGRR